MATLTYAQLEGLWIANGGNRAVAPLAAAIAEAESSGRTDVTSANPDGGINVGIIGSGNVTEIVAPIPFD